jgi:hypothetical protein
MKLMKRTLIVCLIFVFIVDFIPIPLLAQDRVMLAKTTITDHPIESVSTPDEVLETEKDKKNNWLLWGLVSAALVGGIAAVAGAGGGGGGGGDGDSSGTGSIPVQW